MQNFEFIAALADGADEAATVGDAAAALKGFWSSTLGIGAFHFLNDETGIN